MVLTDVGNRINLHTAGCCQRQLRRVLDQKLHCRKRNRLYRREIKAVGQKMEKGKTRGVSFCKKTKRGDEKLDHMKLELHTVSLKGHLCSEVVRQRRRRIKDLSMIRRTLSMKI